MARTEPSKEENEKAIAELKREMRGAHPMKYKNARFGLAMTFGDYNGRTMPLKDSVYRVEAFDVASGQKLSIADFHFDHFDGGMRRETARMMAEELTERINAQ